MEAIEQLVPLVGDVLVERYELLQELGRGGFGVVFLATQRGLDEDVAVKLLLPHVLANPQLYQRFEREILVAKSLRHPNSVRILDVAKTDRGLPFYVMEFVDGDALDDVLKREGRLSPARTKSIGIQILKSLAEAHSKGVIHRDLKPGNVMLCDLVGESDFVKVLDFGIAKALGDVGKGQQTETGLVLGTPSYMSPEQAVSLRDIDGRSDLYTVGLILAECILGTQVVKGESPFVMLAQHGSRTPLAFPQEITASALWPVINRATQKQREFRYPDATAMRIDLENLSGLPSTDLMMGKVLTPLPGPTTPIAWTPEPGRISDSGLIDSSDGFISDQITVSDPRAVVPKEPKGGSKAMTALLIVLFLAVLIVFSIVLVMLTGDKDTGTVTAEETADDDSTGEQSGELAEAETDETPSTTPDPTAIATANTSIAIAADRVHGAVPATHTIRFRGTSGTRVSLGGELLGITPFEGAFPRVSRTLQLEFECDGYRTTTRDVLLTEELVDVALRRRREDRPEPQPPVEPTEEPLEEPPEPEPPTSPFGDTPIDDREGSDGSSPFGDTPVDDR